MKVRRLLCACATFGVVIAPAAHGAPIGLDEFDGTESLITFDPAWPALETQPFTYQGITFSDHGFGGGTQGLETRTGLDGFFYNISGASRGLCLGDEESYTEIRMNFLTPVHKIGLLASTDKQTLFGLRAYDAQSHVLEEVDQGMPGNGMAVFLGLTRTEDIARAELFEPNGSNGQISFIDDVRFSSVATPEPAIGLLIPLPLMLALMRERARRWRSRDAQ
jgi:hypothetical protein